jgi:uncharacterized protein YggE
LGTGNFPVGVTVMVSADVPVEKWLETQSFNAKSKAQAERFAAALRAQGVPSQDITTLPVQTTELALLGTLAATTVVVSADPAVFARVAREARSYGMRGDTPQMTPADAQALYNQAVALAIERGRATAQAIAAADHQHVGRLLNFVPSPVELAKQLAAAVPAAALMAVGDTTKVTATGIATFELVP